MVPDGLLSSHPAVISPRGILGYEAVLRDRGL